MCNLNFFKFKLPLWIRKIISNECRAYLTSLFGSHGKSIDVFTLISSKKDIRQY